MAVAWVQHQASQSSGFGSSFTPTLPSGLTTGNLMVMVLLAYGVASPTITTPTGWTQQVNGTTTFGVAGNRCRLYVFSKVIAGGETAPAISSSDAFTIQYVSVEEFSGADASPTITAVPGSVTANGVAAVAVPAVTTPSANNLVVWVAGDQAGGAGTYTPPTGGTERVDIRDVSGFGFGISIADKTEATATTVSATSFTRSNTSESALGHTIAVAPFAGVVAPFIAATGTVYTPTFPRVEAPFVAAASSVYTAALVHSGVIEPSFITDASTVYAATLNGAGTATVTAPFVAAATAVYTPTVDRFTSPFITSTTAVYTPTIHRVGIGAQPVGVNIGFDDHVNENAPTWARLDA